MCIRDRHKTGKQEHEPKRFTVYHGAFKHQYHNELDQGHPYSRPGPGRWPGAACSSAVSAVGWEVHSHILLLQMCIRDSPRAISWVANKFTGNSQISEAAKLLCDYALEQTAS